MIEVLEGIIVMFSGFLQMLLLRMFWCNKYITKDCFHGINQRYLKRESSLLRHATEFWFVPCKETIDPAE